jgi:hypothetical protein
MHPIVHPLKRPVIDLTVASFVALAAWVYEFTVITVYGSEVIDMCPHGKLLFWLPLMLAPIEFLFVLRFINAARHQQSKRAIVSAISLFLAVFVLPAALISMVRGCDLDSVEISRQNLSNSGIGKLEELETAQNVFPFIVRFDWSDEKIQVVFKAAKGRSQIVRKRLAVVLGSESNLNF